MANEPEPGAGLKGSLGSFRQLVMEDPALQARLWAVSERESFVTLAVELGERCECRFDAEDVRQAMQTGRRTWIERWVP